jgi:hypothetical protein
VVDHFDGWRQKLYKYTVLGWTWIARGFLPLKGGQIIGAKRL